MAYSMDSLTADCYPGTAVPINKLDIRDDAELAESDGMLCAECHETSKSGTGKNQAPCDR